MKTQPLNRAVFGRGIGAGLIASCALAAWAVGAAQPQAGPVQPHVHDSHDFIFLAEARPVLVRMHVRLDGQPIQAAWDDFMKDLFAYLDVNGDGVLSKDEAERAPTLEQIMSGGLGAAFGGFGMGGPTGAAPTMAELDANKDGTVSLEELASYYRKKGFEPVQFQSQAPVNPFAGMGIPGARSAEPKVEEIAETIFALLDTNKDGKLTRDELAAAPEILLRLDVNDDEIVTLRELMPAPKPSADKNLGAGKGMAMAGGLAGGGPAKAENKLLLPVNLKGEGPADLAILIRQRYGATKVGAIQLSREELGLDEATFAMLDTDGDGMLDENELAAFGKRPPDVQLRLRLGTTGPKERRAELVTAKKLESPLVGHMLQKDGFVFVDLGRTRFDLRPSEESLSDRLGGLLRQQIGALFKQADKEKKGYLDEKTAMANPVFKGMFKAADRDGDGKLYEAELLAYLEQLGDLQKRARMACVAVVATDQSRGLFDLLDDNRDGRLSVREMRGAVKLLEHAPKGKDFLTREDMPRSYRLTLRRGPADSGANLAAAIMSLYGGADAGEAVPEPTAGPLWFRKMDRNRDGDVSRREFLGTDEEFRRIDTDGDGLISVEEAERYDAQFRKRN